ncbi:MAG: hypothetical protein H6815_10270 [Phycisphaeraceae bacterium]|nr:hypothetical protein [Phycisphaerales bacterium]MCB9860824.1 hypothetical protein [Phycisphaeraceae bacterium]
MVLLHRRVGRIGVLIASLTATVICTSGALAQSAITQVNALYSTITEANRSDTVLLPAIAKMTPPPAGAFTDQIGASIINEQSSSWPALTAWAGEPEQIAALEALRNATTEKARGVSRAFGLRYGASETSPENVSSGLFVELGDPPLLGRADFLYLNGISKLRDLTNIEATRLLVEGEPAKSLDLMLNLASLGRQLMDREFPAEAAYGYQLSIDAIRRMRDIVYVDFVSGQPKLSPVDLVKVIRTLEPKSDFMRFDRLGFPRGPEYASKQIIDQTFGPNPGDKPTEAFATMVAQLSTGGHPLRMFGEVAHARAAAQSHADRYDSDDYAKRAQDDFSLRWRLSNNDAQLLQALFVDSIDPTRFAVVRLVYNEHARKLRELRQMLETELVGTQIALGIVSFHLQNNSYPRSLAAIRPKYVQEIANDPFSREASTGAQPWFGYFVPKLINVRDLGVREEAQPHTINVVMQSQQNFSLLIDSDQFVLYSTGPDGKLDRAHNVREDATENFPGDYLVWPSVTSLYRRHLQESGLIK